MDDEPRRGMTIKGVPVATRETMAALAANDRTSIAELLVAMVRREKAARSEDASPPPPQLSTGSAGGTLAAPPDARAVSPRGNLPVSDDRDARLLDLLAAAATLSVACGGRLSTVPGLRALCAERVREARGLPPLPARPPRRAALADRALPNSTLQ